MGGGRQDQRPEIAKSSHKLFGARSELKTEVPVVTIGFEVDLLNSVRK